MIIHHMSNGIIKNSIKGSIIPKNFEAVYKLANKRKKENKNGSNETRTIREK